MIEKIKEIGDEFKTISMTGTGDAVVLPIAFLFINNRWGAQTAGLSTLVFSIFLILLRKKQGKPLKYIALGCLGSVTAAVFTLISQRSENYFLPDLMGNAFILCIALGSLMYKKPLAAWASHLTRGWDIEWYWRKDVLPAYYEVTIGWSVFFRCSCTHSNMVFPLWKFAKLNNIQRPNGGACNRICLNTNLYLWNLETKRVKRSQCG